ncbi:MAG: hypothetical protein VZR09_03965 [Candidatus Gastranaerophilaceae bacterium]|nr:hypothetical protein [Candidatus Gastranaerophilaceae bacterium]
MNIRELNEKLDKVLNESKEYDKFLNACEKYKDILDEMKALVKKYIGYEKESQQFTHEYDEKDGNGGYFNVFLFSNNHFVFGSLGIVKKFREYTIELDLTLNNKQHIYYTTSPKRVEEILKDLIN